MASHIEQAGVGGPAEKFDGKNSELREGSKESGIDPLDYMLQVMRDEAAPDLQRIQMAKAAVAYSHAKIAAAKLEERASFQFIMMPEDRNL
jgi:hypothetical protein